MKDEKIEMRNNTFKSLFNKNDFYKHTINTQLTLRKKKTSRKFNVKKTYFIRKRNK